MKITKAVLKEMIEEQIKLVTEDRDLGSLGDPKADAEDMLGLIESTLQEYLDDVIDIGEFVKCIEGALEDFVGEHLK